MIVYEPDDDCRASSSKLPRPPCFPRPAQRGYGRHALSAGKDKSVRLWDLTRGKELQGWPGRTNRCVALSPDGSLVLTGNVSDGRAASGSLDKTVILWG